MTLAEAVRTIRDYCDKQTCRECDLNCENSPNHWKIPPEANLYDVEEIHENCTVQILRNSLTGEESVGWWENEVEKIG